MLSGEGEIEVGIPRQGVRQFVNRCDLGVVIVHAVAACHLSGDLTVGYWPEIAPSYADVAPLVKYRHCTY